MEPTRRPKRMRMANLAMLTAPEATPAIEWSHLAHGTRPHAHVRAADVGQPLVADDIDRVVLQLREPLEAILLELCLVDEPRSATVDRALQRITGKLSAIERVAGELADVAAIERGQFVIERRSTELRSLLVEVLDRALSPRDRARCLVESPAACLAWVDAARMERVILTLVEAALSGSPRDVIVIQLGVVDGIAHLSVIDEGRPVSTAEPTGIGMFVARCIVEAHGGTIGIDGWRGKGSRFYVDLPTERGDDRTRVLLVDDNARQLDALAMLLRREGFDVTAVSSGSAAITSVRSRAVDVAIVDATLPDVSAKELTAQLRDRCASLPIIVVSGHPPDSMRVVEALAACDGRYLSKPIDVEVLLAEIGHCVRTR